MVLSASGAVCCDGANVPRVDFFSVNVFKNPKLMDKGLFPLSDWPLLPYPLVPDLFPYWSTGEAKEVDISQEDPIRRLVKPRQVGYRDNLYDLHY
jgi:hypothetical protein